MASRLCSFALAVVVIAASPGASIKGQDDHNCFSIVVGKHASFDGHVMVAHNEDDGPPQVVNHHKVPRQQHQPGDSITLLNGGRVEQVAETWSYIWSEMPGMRFSDSYLNEWGVSVFSDACPSREDQPELTDGGICYHLRRLVAERARSAREGVHVAAGLVERFGYAASGRTYIIADTAEGWLFSAVNGKHWAARRVPDDSVAMIANTYSIREMDLGDTINFLASSDLMEYAIARGWYTPTDSNTFDFADAYADRDVSVDPRNTSRQWAGYRHVLATIPVPSENENSLPFCVAPERELHPRDLMKILRDHYEATPFLQSEAPNSHAHDQAISTICGRDTQTSFVLQLRSGLPVEVGCVYWVCLGSPCASVYLPYYFGVDAFPASWYTQAEAPNEETYQTLIRGKVTFGDGPAFWNFSRLRTLAEENPASFALKIREVALSVEESAFAHQAESEKAAFKLLQSGSVGEAVQSLDDYSLGVQSSALEALQAAVDDFISGAKH